MPRAGGSGGASHGGEAEALRHALALQQTVTEARLRNSEEFESQNAALQNTVQELQQLLLNEGTPAVAGHGRHSC